MKLPERGAEHCVDLLRAFNKEGVEYLIGGSMARSQLLLGLTPNRKSSAFDMDGGNYSPSS